MLSLFFPEVCPICGRPIGKGEDPSRKACSLCLSGLKRITGPVCLRCGRPVSSPTDAYCGQCKKTGFDSHASFEQGICLFPYAEVKEGLMELKYKNRREYAEFFGREGSLAAGDLIRNVWKADALLPVPVHRIRGLLRGYNQAALIARVLGRELDLPVEEHLLVRTRQTTAQKKLDPLERLRNLQGAFAVNGDPSGLRRVVLVDDVFTTGSTVESCARVLRKVGVQQVFFLAVAAAASEDQPILLPGNGSEKKTAGRDQEDFILHFDLL